MPSETSRIAVLEEKVRRLAEERDAALAQVRKSQEAQAEKADELRRGDALIEGIAGGTEDMSLTEQVRMQQALAESEVRFRTLFTAMTEGFALGEPILDGEGFPKDFRFLEINEAFKKQTGLSPEVVGQPASVALPNLEPFWIETYCRVALEGEPVRFEQFNQDTGRWYDVYCYRPSEGRFAILFRDITENRRVQEILRERKSTARSSKISTRAFALSR